MKIKNIVVSLVICAVLITGTNCVPFIEAEMPASAAPSVSTNEPCASSILNTKTTVEIPDFVSVIAAVRPSVVAITTEVPVHFFGRTFTQEGAGSGWIIEENGVIVTNYHVVEDARNVTVTLEDGRSFPAESVHSDSAADLAVIKINARNLPALQIGDSSEIEVGEWVVAIGNSLGLSISATKGIVSVMGVSIATSPGETLDDLIQTDAAINPGNSGGPLVNLLGQVVGINTAKVAQVGVEGMGYAISINKARPIVDKLMRES